MVQEEYISFETAKLLKEKGFDEDFDADIVKWYNVDGGDENLCSLVDFRAYKCPSLAMMMKWLREIHGLFISIGNDDLDYNWQIFNVRNRTKDLDPTCLTDSYAGYRKYEEACEAAIKYCLEHLIQHYDTRTD